MERTLIIYDLNGKIVSQISSGYEFPNGLPYIEIEIPQGKYIKSVNVDTKEPIFDDLPKTEIQLLEDKISILESQQANTEYVLMMGGLI